MPKMANLRRDRTEVSYVIKYLVFGFNVLFWLCGGALAAAGIWAWSEKDTFNNLSKVTQVPDPAFAFIIIGIGVFFIGSAGCVGALRENTCLLSLYCIVIGLLFASQVIVGILAFAYKDWVVQQVKDQLKKMLVLYREDEDLQNVIDWVQGDWLMCCGVDSHNDWDNNEYFNCSSPSVEACGVPFSCCRFDDNYRVGASTENSLGWLRNAYDNEDYPTEVAEKLFLWDTSWISEGSRTKRSAAVMDDDYSEDIKGEVIIKNTQCGFGVREDNVAYTPADRIYVEGCLTQGQDWLNDNIIPVAGIVVAVALLQILGICLATNLRNDVEAQKDKSESFV